MGKTLQLPGGQQYEIGEPSEEVKALAVVAQNQGAIHQMLQQISNQLEIQLRVQVGYDSKAGWKKRFEEADAIRRAEVRAREAASESDLQGTDEDRPSESGGGRAIEEAAGEEGVSE